MRHVPLGMAASQMQPNRILRVLGMAAAMTTFICETEDHLMTWGGTCLRCGQHRIDIERADNDR